MPEYYDNNGNRVNEDGSPFTNSEGFETTINNPDSFGPVMPNRPSSFVDLPQGTAPQNFFDQVMEFGGGLMGFPSAYPTQSKANQYGELVQTGLPILGGTAASIYGLKKYLGAKNALPAAESALPKIESVLGKPLDIDPNFNQGIGDAMMAGSKPYPHTSGIVNPTSQVVSGQVTPTVIQTPVQKLGEALKSTVPLNAEQKAIYSAERSQKLGAFKDKPVTSMAEYDAQKKALSGELTKVEMTPLQLEQNDVDSLVAQIAQHPKSIGFNQIHATEGLKKILTGRVPTESEVKQLTEVFGKDFSDVMVNLPKVDTKRNLVSEAVNLPRALMASYDLSAPLRQGLGLVHRKEYRTSFDDMFKSLGSQKAFNEVQRSIASKPTFDLMQEHKLSLTDLHNLSNREEAFMSNWAERIPVVGKGVAASNRAYVGFLNKLRSDTFDTLVHQAAAANGVGDPHKLDPYLLESIAKYVNNATGRGDLGRMEQSAVALNNVFFSPRLIKSRLEMLNPNNYVNPSIPKEVRKEYLRSLMAIASFGATAVGLGTLAGADVEANPTSSDFGKVKFGNTRLDPWGGFQQYIVAASKLMSNQQTSPISGRSYELGSKYGLPTRLDVAARFGESKLNPVLSFATTMLRGKDFTGQPVNVSNEVASRFIPLVMQDIYELANENPGLLPIGAPAAIFGMGTQTFGQDR